MTTDISNEVIDRLCAVVGPAGCLRVGDDMDKYLIEWRDRWHGATPVVLRPQTTDEVRELVAICAQTKTPIVPQGGNTGLVGGQIPDGGQVLISLERLNRIRSLSPDDHCLEVEAGCVLETVQKAADEAGLLFPLSLASEGSAQVGGLASTNAGGVHVVRYGPMADLVLGVEAVTGRGEIFSDLKPLRKDNTGYRLRQMFVGAEGTLGIITALRLRLVARPRDVQTMLMAVPDPARAVQLLSLGNALSGGLIQAFELMPRIGIDFVVRHVAGARDPFDPPSPWYVLAEFAGGTAPDDLRPVAEHFLESGYENHLITDGVIAASSSQAHALWQLRERLSEVQKQEGASLKHDISVPVSALPGFLEQALAAVSERVPGIRPVPFGHVGDGNIHFNLSQPLNMSTDDYLARRDDIAQLVHDLVANFNGSFSAEHGVGIARLDDMKRYKDPVALDLMARVKAAFDPAGIFNPGRVLRPGDGSN